MLAVLSKELRGYFNSAIGYIFMGIFLLISGIFFAFSNLLVSNGDYNSVLGSISFVFLLLVPLLTMKLISDETRNRTDQLLLTSPLNIWGIIMGKFLSSVVLFGITLLVTCIYPIILKIYGSISGMEIFCAYIGFFLLGCALISVGIFMSSLTENQMVAAVSTFGVLLIIWIMDWIQQELPGTMKSGIIFAVILVILLTIVIYYATKNFIVSIGTTVLGGIIIIAGFLTNKSLFEGFVSKFFGWFSLLKRYNMFAMGILSLNSIIYYVSFTFIFLFLTVRVIEKRRWC